MASPLKWILILFFGLFVGVLVSIFLEPETSIDCYQCPDENTKEMCLVQMERTLFGFFSIDKLVCTFDSSAVKDVKMEQTIARWLPYLSQTKHQIILKTDSSMKCQFDLNVPMEVLPPSPPPTPSRHHQKQEEEEQTLVLRSSWKRKSLDYGRGNWFHLLQLFFFAKDHWPSSSVQPVDKIPHELILDEDPNWIENPNDCEREPSLMRCNRLLSLQTYQYSISFLSVFAAILISYVQLRRW